MTLSVEVSFFFYMLVDVNNETDLRSLTLISIDLTDKSRVM